MADGRGYSSRGRQLSRRATLRMGAVGVAGSAAWLAACGGGGNDNDTVAEAPSGASATAPAVRNQVGEATGTAKRGGTYTYRSSGTPPLDPVANTSFRAQYIAGFTYSRLLKFKAGVDPAVSMNYEIEPDLAQSVEVPSDGMQVTFKLQPNAVFHNKPPVNGRAVTSEDVKIALERFRTEPKNTNRNAFGSPANPIVESVETPDDKTFVVKLAKPYAPIQNLFANPQYLWILPKEQMGGFDPAKEQIGSGPFILQSVQPDVSVDMVRNPNWWVKDKPNVDAVKAAIIAEVAQEVAQFQAERLDTADIPSDKKAEVEKSNPKVLWRAYLPTTYSFIAPQQREGSPFRDERLRRAMSMAVDRAAIGDLVYLNQGVRSLTALPASMGRWWVDPNGPNAGPGGANYKFNPAEAKKLVQAAGFENQTLRFIYTNNAYGEVFNQAAEAMSGMMNAGGFKAQTIIQDYNREYIASNGTFFGTYEGAFYGLQTPFTDPHDYLFNMLSPQSARNHAGVNDPQLTQMIQDEERTLVEADRLKKVHDIQRYVMEKMYYIPTVVGFAYTAVQPWIKNFQYSGTYGFGTESRANLWIDRG